MFRPCESLILKAKSHSNQNGLWGTFNDILERLKAKHGSTMVIPYDGLWFKGLIGFMNDSSKIVSKITQYCLLIFVTTRADIVIQ